MDYNLHERVYIYIDRNRAASIIVVYNYLWAKGVEAVKCNGRNMDSKIRDGSFASYYLILAPPNFSGPQFSHLRNGVVVRIK